MTQILAFSTYRNNHQRPLPPSLLQAAHPRSSSFSSGRIKTLPYRSKDPMDIERSILLIPSETKLHSKNSHPSTKASTTTITTTTSRKYQYVIGTDESGTGCIAGPIIVVSCCILQPLYHDHMTSSSSTTSSSSFPSLGNNNVYQPYPKIMDCKSLSAYDCAQIYQHIQQHPDRYAYTVAYIYPNHMNHVEDHQINNINSHNAIPKLITNAMAQTIEHLIDDHLLSRMVDATGTGTSLLPSSSASSSSASSSLASSSPSSNCLNSTKRAISKIYSIVDGHRSVPPTAFQKYSITSRPYVSGDSYVYTIALASCIARHLHESYMQKVLHVQYPQYQFHIHGGYPTVPHLQAIHTHGIITPTSTSSTTTTSSLSSLTNDTGVHRLCCQPIQKLMSSSVIPPKLRPTVVKNTNVADNNEIHQGNTNSISTNTNEMSRQTFLSSSSLMMSALTVTLSTTIAAIIPSAVQVSNAMYMDKTNGISYPNIGEIESAVPRDWSIIENPFIGDGIDTPSLFTRLDTTNDTIFYNTPRFVEHIDDAAVQTITQYIDQLLLSVSNSDDNTQTQTRASTAASSTAASSTTATTTYKGISCLDLCASWTSHISLTKLTSTTKVPPRIVGLGMNENELQANTALTEYVIQDLNQDHPKLPFVSNSFDIILCQLSIDYLIHPFDVCCEMARVLKDATGQVHIFFSNRSFLSKAVAVWTGKDDIDHTFLVASYLYYCNDMCPSMTDGTMKSRPVFTNIQAHDLSKRTKSGKVIGDPLYLVSATKAS